MSGSNDKEPTQGHGFNTPNEAISVSAICPAFNRAHVLADAIQSFFRGAPSEWEMIVVDDASVDKTAEVMSDMSLKLPGRHLRYLKLDSNKGAPAARNAGLLAAQGVYVMFIDSDDTCDASGILDLKHKLDGATADYAYGKVLQTTGRGCQAVTTGIVGSPWNGDSAGIADLDWQTMGALYRRKFLLNRVGLWNESLTGSQDWELQARVKLSGGYGVFVDTVIGCWCRSGADRIGAGGYKRAYVESVLEAVLSIEKTAQKMGRYEKPLRWRLARRLLNHVIEATANGDRELAKLLGRSASRIGGGLLALTPVNVIVDLCPEWLSAQILSTVREQSGQK